MISQESKMKKKTESIHGEGELFKGSAHAAYCRYLINSFVDETGQVSKEGTVTLSKEGMTPDAFKKLALFFVFHRSDTYRLMTDDHATLDFIFSEFNAFAGEGIFKI